MEKKKKFNYPNGKAWTDEEIQLLSAYPQKSEQELAKELNRSVMSVTRKLERLGYRKTQQRSAYWTAEEVDYLYSYYGTKGAKAIGKKLGRTTRAVHSKAEQLGLVAYTEYWTMRLLSKAFQVDPAVIHRWHDKFDMPMHRIRRDGEYCYRIKEEEFWKWAANHIDLIPWQTYQVGALTGEPDNIQQLHDQAQIRMANHRKYLTPRTKKRIVNAYKHGCSIKLLAEQEQRTESSIKHIIADARTQKSVGYNN